MVDFPAMPSNYDDVTITVDPFNMNTAVSTIHSAATDVGNALGDISNTLKDLKLSWEGKASDTSDELNQQWIAIVDKLFGVDTAAMRRKGALDVVMNGVDQIAQNYAQTEQAIHDMFQKMYDSILNPTIPTTSVNITVDGTTYTVNGVPLGSTLNYWADGATQHVDVPGDTSGSFKQATDDGTDAPYYSTSVNET